MKKILTYLYVAAAAALLPATAAGAKDEGRLATENLSLHRAGSRMEVNVDFVLDSLNLGANRQLYVTPVVDGPDGQEVVMPTVLINGRNMQYAFERKSLPKDIAIAGYDLKQVVRRHNGKPQRVAYSESTPLQRWMLSPKARIYFLYDTCGCGRGAGRAMGPGTDLDLNPAPKMRLVNITPPVTELPVSIHEGEARVQFEVDKTELHTEPYRTRRGNQLIDNRQQLSIIDDSVKYALTDPNVEIASINVCGYASPESPYLHNEYLATNRSRALAEYLAQRYNLPAERSTYDAVPENWGEFREKVLSATDITEQQRADLLELIDAPVYGPADYDAKEKTLKTDPRFAKLYASKILPEWFPRLRATKFAISTRLKPLSDEKLAEIIYKTPELMSLNQMFRVARLYPEGSDKFNEIIDIALSRYPDDPIANLNAAVALINEGKLDEAEKLLEKAGNTPEALNARGVIEAHRGNFDKAGEYFNAAGNLPEALRNKALLDD